jgi:hypothetical protein
MSEAIVPDLAAVATHPSNTPLILQRLLLERAVAGAGLLLARCVSTTSEDGTVNHV